MNDKGASGRYPLPREIPRKLAMTYKKAVPVLILALAFAACTAKETVIIKRDAAPAPPAAGERDLWTLDYRYAPAWWQTAIGLPDDWQKTLLSKEGLLLYDYREGGGLEAFGTRVGVGVADADGTATFQAMPDPRVPVVETILSGGDGRELARWTALAVVPGEGQDLPRYKKSRLAQDPAKPPRGDLFLVRKAAVKASLRLTVESREPLDVVDRTVLVGRRRFLSFSAAWNGLQPGKNSLTVSFPAKVTELAVYCASGHEAGDVGLDWAKAQEPRARDYWLGLDFPAGVLRVPDPAVQELLASCVRNIYQAREIKDGRPVFQVGPTCYRGLWVVDGAFILEAMAYLGRGREARAGIEHLLTRRNADGSFDLLGKYWKENGIVLYLLYRHAQLTHDPDWLRARWPVVVGAVEAIKRLRNESRADPAAPEAGLMPPGTSDGGVPGVRAEYTNVYWNLAGLKAAIEAARLLGAPELSAWEAEYADFRRAFDRAVARDAKPYGEGRIILAVPMVPDPEIAPIRGQWAFCHAVFPGKIFAANEPLVRGNMALLDDNLSEGLVYGTGWMADGIWNYFGSFYAHAHLWQGNGALAARTLYAFANHASPLRAWREEQPPKERAEGAKFVGDMPHNWASAEFIRLVRNLLVLERGTELHMLEGLPRIWLAPGAVTEIKDAATDFGPFSMRLEVAADGAAARLALVPPAAAELARVVVHLGAWAGEAEPEIEDLRRDGGAGEIVLTIPLAPLR